MKKPRPPRDRKTRRNPLAKALAGGLFRKRVLKRRDTYIRRRKHRLAEDGAE